MGTKFDDIISEIGKFKMAQKEEIIFKITVAATEYHRLICKG